MAEFSIVAVFSLIFCAAFFFLGRKLAKNFCAGKRGIIFYFTLGAGLLLIYPVDPQGVWHFGAEVLALLAGIMAGIGRPKTAWFFGCLWGIFYAAAWGLLLSGKSLDLPHFYYKKALALPEFNYFALRLLLGFYASALLVRCLALFITAGKLTASYKNKQKGVFALQVLLSACILFYFPWGFGFLHLGAGVLSLAAGIASPLGKRTAAEVLSIGSASSCLASIMITLP